jgi:hypothetical protein
MAARSKGSSKFQSLLSSVTDAVKSIWRMIQFASNPPPLQACADVAQ